MALNDNQRATVLVAVKADATAAAIRTSGDVGALRDWLNASSGVSAWRHGLTGADLYAAHRPKDYLARTAAERAGFDLMCAQPRLDFTVAKIRNGVADIFSGTTNSASRTDIFTAARENATRAENILGGSPVSVGGTADMAETVTALRRNWIGLVDSGDAEWLIQQP